MMRHVVSMSLAVAGLALLMASDLPGAIVDPREVVDLVRGKECQQLGEPYIQYCYGGNCQTGGCGCITQYTTYVVQTGGTPKPDIPCREDPACKATLSWKPTCNQAPPGGGD